VLPTRVRGSGGGAGASATQRLCVRVLAWTRRMDALAMSRTPAVSCRSPEARAGVAAVRLIASGSTAIRTVTTVGVESNPPEVTRSSPTSEVGGHMLRPYLCDTAIPGETWVRSDTGRTFCMASTRDACSCVPVWLR
jgi:hypothetical protein